MKRREQKEGEARQIQLRDNVRLMKTDLRKKLDRCSSKARDIYYCGKLKQRVESAHCRSPRGHGSWCLHDAKITVDVRRRVPLVSGVTYAVRRRLRYGAAQLERNKLFLDSMGLMTED